MTKSLCLLAFDALNSKLHPGTSPVSLSKFDSITNGSADDYPLSAPLFVTWNKNGQLRGCIGTFLPLKIESGVRKFALTSALDDPRFPPVRSNEFSQLSVSVTLLAKFTPIKDPLDWEIGLHGLKVLFEEDNDYFSGTFLPSVAEEQEWDKNTTLWYLLRKAGYESVSKANTEKFYQTAIANGSMHLERYDGLKSELTYEDYESVNH